MLSEDLQTVGEGGERGGIAASKSVDEDLLHGGWGQLLEGVSMQAFHTKGGGGGYCVWGQLRQGVLMQAFHTKAGVGGGHIVFGDSCVKVC